MMNDCLCSGLGMFLNGGKFIIIIDDVSCLLVLVI